MRYMIDEPTPFDTIATWEAYLKSLQALDQDRPEVKEAIAKAKEHIAEDKR